MMKSEKVINRQQRNQYLFFCLEHLADEDLQFGHVGEGFPAVFGKFPIEREVTSEHDDFISDEITGGGTISASCICDARRATA